MKNLILSLVLIFSATQLPAQVKTGGGGGPDFDSPDSRTAEYEANKRLEYIFADLNKELIRIELQCKLRTSVPPKYNFIDSFYSLSLKKNSIEECAPSKKVSHCLKTKAMKEIMKDIKDTPGGVLFNYLKKKHNLDEKDGLIILKFFGLP